MPYLIDSDWLIDHLADVPEAVELLQSLAPEGIAISIISYMEVFQGTRRSAEPEEAHAGLQDFVDAVPTYCLIRFSLEKDG